MRHFDIFIEKEDGAWVFHSVLEPSEFEACWELFHTLEAEIPKAKSDLEKQYGDSVLYNYYLGKFLRDFMEEHGISWGDKEKLWNEIVFATEDDVQNKKEAKKSSTFYEYCYTIAEYDEEEVKVLSWKRWQYLLKNLKNRSYLNEEEIRRLIKWINSKDEEIQEADWKKFIKGLKEWLKKKNLSVFTDDKLFAVYDEILETGTHTRKNNR